jgi:hypothetical protein
MGVFDDAIREHLELKRRRGASDEEVEQALGEALGRAGPVPPEPHESAVSADEPSRPEETALTADEPSSSGEAPAAEESQPASDPRQEARAEPEPGEGPADEPAELVDELEPDEVLPEEALDGAHSPSEWPNGRPAPAVEDEELLEDEEPDFLEERSDQDRLWFEQKRPKDFDFDD